MVERKSEKLLSTFGLPEPLTKLLSAALSPDEVEQFAQLPHFVDLMRQMGSSYTRLEESLDRQEKKIGELKHPVLMKVSGDQIKKSRIRNFEFIKDVMLKSIRDNRELIRSETQTQARLAEIEKNLVAGLQRICEERNARIASTIAGIPKK